MAKVKPYNPSTTSLRSKKGILLYLFLIPLFIAVILALFQTNIQAFLLNSLAFTLFFTTAKLSTKGFTQELEYLRSPLTKDRLYALMEDLDTRFDKELERLKSNNQFDLDAHIDVLKEQIKN